MSALNTLYHEKLELLIKPDKLVMIYFQIAL